MGLTPARPTTQTEPGSLNPGSVYFAVRHGKLPICYFAPGLRGFGALLGAGELAGGFEPVEALLEATLGDDAGFADDDVPLAGLGFCAGDGLLAAVPVFAAGFAGGPAGFFTAGAAAGLEALGGGLTGVEL